MNMKLCIKQADFQQNELKDQINISSNISTNDIIVVYNLIYPFYDHLFQHIKIHSWIQKILCKSEYSPLIFC